MNPEKNLDQLSIATIRTLSMDAIEQANSGHPGTPMGMAPVAYTLWQRLFLTGVKSVDPDYEIPGTPSVTLEDIKCFRQPDSKCPGHPEYHLTSGVETTTGPLGSGVATSVGMAIASRWLSERYNQPGFTMFDFDVYALAGDGCLMEGISSEAASLAGHLKLSNLCWIYDNNHITIEGNTSLAFSEDVAVRFLSYGWNVWRVGDANDLERLEDAFTIFKKTTDRPTLIIVDSHIAYGAPGKQDTSGAHGEPLGEETIRKTKKVYGWPEDAKFLVPDEVLKNFSDGIGARGAQLSAEWDKLFVQYKKKYPDLAREIEQMQRRELPVSWDKDIPVFPTDAKGLAGREASGKVLNAIAKNHPWLLGGAADLAPSTKTRLTFEGAGDFLADSYRGRNFHFGVREHAMASIGNGLALSKLRPFVSGFFIFTDYCRAQIRLAALMEIPVIYIWTHDSIGVGEDGPTHQPIEQLASFRAMPGMIVLRPGDPNEVAEAWRVVMQLKHHPAMLVLSRQAQPTLDRTRFASAAGVAKGAYILADAPDGKPDVLLIATGTELALAVSAYEQLIAEGIKVRVVSMPSWELFEQQDKTYRDTVLPPNVLARVAIEQASTFGWAQYVGLKGAVVGMKTFGASAPLKALLHKFGFTVDAVIAAAKEQLANGG
ncbi:MAG: transketolase [Anaerolineales bacterium]|nr:transketolase [Anaerolineales bacterium]